MQGVHCSFHTHSQQNLSGSVMSTQSSHIAGSRAMKIPMHNYNMQSSYQTSGPGRRSGAQRLPKLERADSSDREQTSSSSSANSWTESPKTPHTQFSSHAQNVVASPSDLSGLSSSQSQPQRKDKQREQTTQSPPNTLPTYFQTPQSPLGPTMLSSSAYKSVNLSSHISGDSDEPARIITYTKHSQGFTWNDELFLPSYLVGRYRSRGSGGSKRYRSGYGWDEGEDDDIGDYDEDVDRCPVTDIFVTDEEAAAMMP